MKKILRPGLDSCLAEFLGIHFGGGSLYIGKRQTYRYAISLNLKKDYEYPVIKLTTNVHHLAMQLCMKLSELGFRANIQKKDNSTTIRYDVVLNGWKQLELWKNVIGTRNTRNILCTGPDGI